MLLLMVMFVFVFLYLCFIITELCICVETVNHEQLTLAYLCLINFANEGFDLIVYQPISQSIQLFKVA